MPALYPGQLAQLSTLSYKLKKEKCDKTDSTQSKKNPSSSSSVTLSPTLVDPARVSVIMPVNGQDTGLRAQPAEKKKKCKKRKSRSNLSFLSHLASWLQCPLTRSFKNWTRNGQTDLRLSCWPRHWTGLNRNRSSVQSSWSQLTHHQPMPSGQSLSSTLPASQFLRPLTDLLCLLTNLLWLHLPAHQPLLFNLTGQ